MSLKLYIQIDENGNTVNHPILEDNFRQAFPDIDVDNLPTHFARFERVEEPFLGIYEILDPEEPTYEMVDGVYKDIWHVRNMTQEEKLAKQQKIKDNWASLPDRDNFTAWTFSEETCRYEPPVPQPGDGKVYFWQGTTSSWVEYPRYPTDGKRYKLNMSTGLWEEKT